jgi:hypothetical protein
MTTKGSIAINRKSSWESRGNPKRFKGKAIVAFIDILGFSTDIKKNWTSDNPVKRLMQFREKSDFKRSFFGFPAEDGAKFHSYSARVQMVSDSVIMSIPLDRQFSDQGFAPSLRTICGQITIAWLFAIDSGYTIRGGVEFGDIVWTPKELIGPALIDAYLLESREARWSRVICGPELLDRTVNSAAALRHVQWGLLDKSDDGLIEVLYFEIYDRYQADEPSRQDTIKKLEVIKQRAGPAGLKYDPLLKRLNEPWNGISVTRQAMLEARDKLRDALRLA